MKHWTHDVVPGAGVALLPAGVALSFGVHAWGGIACVALGVLLLAVCLALEVRATTLKALDVEGDVERLTKDVMELRTAQAKTAEDTATALRGLAASRVVPRAPGY